jgi:hypothetical protein
MVAAGTVYPLRAVRALALHAQGLTTPNGAEPRPTPDAVAGMVARLGCLQLDTLHVVQRSHYLALWSRLGDYDPGNLDRLVYREPRRLFESWLHAACIVPLTEYRYRLPHMRRLREKPSKWSRPQPLRQPVLAKGSRHPVLGLSAGAGGLQTGGAAGMGLFLPAHPPRRSIGGPF